MITLSVLFKLALTWIMIALFTDMIDTCIYKNRVIKRISNVTAALGFLSLAVSGIWALWVFLP